MKLDQLEKLKGLRQELDPNNLVPAYEEQEVGVVVNEAEREAVHQQLLAQHEEKGKVFELDLFEEVSGPDSDDHVEVTYFDGVVSYVDISFEKVGEKMSEEQYLAIRQNLRNFARANTKQERQNYLRDIASVGPNAVEVVFRECRQFDLVPDTTRAEVIEMLARLAYRNLDARLLVKGILQYSATSSHTMLAIGVAGALRDEQMVHSLLKHMRKQEYFKIALDALLKIRHVGTLESLIIALEELDSSQKHLVDYAISQASRFKKFGPQAIELIYNYYEQGKNRGVRKIYIDAICAFGEDAIPQLLQAIQRAKQIHDLGRLSQICMTLGNLRTPASTAALARALEQANEREKRAIIIGLGRAADESVMDMIVYELQHTEDIVLKSECINALSFLRNKREEVTKIVTPYLQVQKNNLFLDATGCLVRMGHAKHLDTLINSAINGNDREQDVAQMLISRLPLREIVRTGQRILTLSDEQALKIVTLLQRANKMPQELAPVFKEKLQTPMSFLLEVEIYRLIAKHVNSTPPFLPAEVLYEARNKTTNERMQRELSNMISKIATRGGVIITNE